MTRIRFHQELDDLKHRILAMAGMAEQAIDLSVQAYSQRDAALCQRVLNNENAINRAEREVDEFAIDLLAMQQPMAIDLRFILAVLKINADLERVGDQAVNIVVRLKNVPRKLGIAFNERLQGVADHGANFARHRRNIYGQF